MTDLEKALQDRALRNLGRELREDELRTQVGDKQWVWDEATRRMQEHEKQAVEQAAAVMKERCKDAVFEAYEKWCEHPCCSNIQDQIEAAKKE